MINSLNEAPVVSNSWSSLFSHAVSYYPKTMLAGLVSTSIGLGHMCLSILSEDLGPFLEKLMVPDDPELPHKYIIPAALSFTMLTFGVGCASAALLKSRPNKTVDVEEPVEEKRSLLTYYN